MPKTRKDFLKETGIITGGLLTGGLSAPFSFVSIKNRDSLRWQGSERSADLVIIGGGTGGCAAALSALKMGLSVIMTEPTDWIGGQLTSQAVPPDENPWVEDFGASRSYQQYRRHVRQYYQENYPVIEGLRDDEFFNPGDGWVSRIAHEPQVSVAVIEAILSPWISNR